MHMNTLQKKARMRSFQVGEKVLCDFGHYKDHTVTIDSVHIGFNPVLYSCSLTINGVTKYVSLFENELAQVE